mmetsp:Transcript_2464/g.3502  ORF Transcript_2464/g.3502 Transcript_2464/m.3502 type:complete len:490 (-) Transcript_2464:399-1868(-)
MGLNRLLKRAWLNSLPVRLRVIRGKPKYLLGLIVQSCVIGIFIGLLIYGLRTSTTTNYLSIEKEEKIKSTEDVLCLEIPLTQSTELEVDEQGHWSNDADYDARKSLKEVQFLGFSGGASVYDEEISELNSCINDMNALFTDQSLIYSLLYLDNNYCEGEAGTRIDFPIKWPYIFDASFSDVWILDSNEDYVWDITGEVSVSSNSLYNLKFVCSSANNSTDICSTNSDYTVTLNVDSLARCIAVNEGFIDASYTDDLKPLYVDTELDYFEGVYTGTESPSTMVLQYGVCYIYYSDRNAFLFLQPSIEYWDTNCQVSCSDDRSSCYNDFDLNIMLQTGDQTVVINTYGGRGFINDNFYLLNQTGSSCGPLLNPLQNSDADIPFTLIESFYNCTKTVHTSALVALSSAYANTSLAVELLVGLAVIIALRLCSGAAYLKYHEDDLEMAQIELAIARINEKVAANRHEDSFTIPRRNIKIGVQEEKKDNSVTAI